MLRATGGSEEPLSISDTEVRTGICCWGEAMALKRRNVMTDLHFFLFVQGRLLSEEFRSLPSGHKDFKDAGKRIIKSNRPVAFILFLFRLFFFCNFVC